MRSKSDGARRSRPIRKPAGGRPRDVDPRRRPSAEAPDEIERGDEQRLGPYERRYDVSRGYAIERTVIRP